MVLLLSFIEWEGAFQRPHHLAMGLAEDRRVVHVHWRRVHHIVREGRVSDVLRARATESLDGRLVCVAVPAFPRDSVWAFARWMNNVIMMSHLRSILRRAPRRAVIVNAPDFAPALRWFDWDSLVFDVMDDLADSESRRRDEAWLLDHADHVATGTLALCRDRGKRRPDATFVPCGVDFEHFHAATQPSEDSQSLRRRFGLSARPVAGFFGALNHRLDGALLDHLAENAEDFDFLMIGPDYSSAPPLPRGANWVYPGKVDYADLPDHLRLFDVALIPYHTEGMNRALHPVKVMEAMAAERPVICTRLPEVERFYGEFVGLADTPEEFLRLMREAVGDPSAWAPRIADGAQFARERTWEAFVDAFRGFLDGDCSGS